MSQLGSYKKKPVTHGIKWYEEEKLNPVVPLNFDPESQSLPSHRAPAWEALHPFPHLVGNVLCLDMNIYIILMERDDLYVSQRAR